MLLDVVSGPAGVTSVVSPSVLPPSVVALGVASAKHHNCLIVI